MQAHPAAMRHLDAALHVYRRCDSAALSPAAFETLAERARGRSLATTRRTAPAADAYDAALQTASARHGATSLQAAGVVAERAALASGPRRDADALMAALAARAATLHRDHPLVVESLDAATAGLRGAGRYVEADELAGQFGRCVAA